MQRLQAIRPIIRERCAIAPIDLEAGAPRIGRADLEAGGEDDAVDLVLDALEHKSLLRDAIDATALRVDELHVGPVEGRQIFVVEGWALAELAIPGLERLGRRLVLDDLVHARADLVHLL